MEVTVPWSNGRWVGVVGLVALGAIAVGSVLGTAPPAARGADAPVADFSAARAMEHIAAVADAPRSPGSVAHARAREYLVAQLASNGWRVEVQEAVGATDLGTAGTQPLAAVANVVATMPGTAPTGTVLLAAHYDTVAGSPGAADDGIGVGTLLEVARALRTSGADPRNDLTILVTDGEENGLLGAEAFVRERGASLGTTVVLNHEARGAGGAPVTFRTSSPNSTLLAVLSRAPGAAADSGSEAVFEALTNDTDFTVFADGGWHGYDTAIAARSAYYHSPLDDPARLNAGSVQQMGDTSLAVARELAGLDLAAVPAGRDDLVTTLPWGLARLPTSVELPLALGALALVGIQTALLRRRRALTLPRAALSAVAAVVVLVAAALAASAVWWAALLVDPGQASAIVGEPYRPLPYQVAVLAVAVCVVLVGTLLRRRLGPDALAAGSLVALALLGVLLVPLLPGLSTALVPPVLFAALGAVVAALLPVGRAVRGVVVVASLVPAAILLGPGVWAGFDVGLGAGGPAAALLAAVLVLLALPVIELVGPSAGPGRGVAAVALLLTAVMATGVGLYVNREGATDPRQESVLYSLDADTGSALWVSPTPPRSEWSRTLLDLPPASLDDAVPWASGRPLAHGPAPAVALAAPRITVLTDVTRDGVRELRLRVASSRGAPSVGLWVDAATASVRRATVADRDVAVHGTDGRWSFGFLFHAAPAAGLDVVLELEPRAAAVALRVADRSDDLSSAPAVAPAGGRVLVNPHVVVTRQAEV
jgi:hypothetical protein